MSRSKEPQLIAELRAITGATSADALKLAKKHKTIEGAIDGFYSDMAMQSRAAPQGAGANGSGSSKAQEKKLGEIFDQYKDPDTKTPTIKIDGTLRLCEDLGIDPESDIVMFCLAADLGSKSTGQFEKGPFVSGWLAISSGIDSLEAMSKALPKLRKNVYSDPAYFKKVYMHSFDIAKAEGSRTLGLDEALALWPLFVKPALEATPSALTHIPNGSPPLSASSDPPQFSERHFDQWIEFMTKKGKAVSKDTWSLLFDFIRTIDAGFKDYDETAAWPSTIDDFVEYVRDSQ